ncbi:hypothetical protein Q0F99_12615 [Rathayibacter oskolensis]|uniref:hypothetical protein n=1 Tax=Rathayibacter oskolensis TaxID=1891671 RepID=UPI0026602D39|nr:hypothetical protein [Rathayibacter oskolensis]WKK70660.1 hypothetical protein Q0F99_12615 [Rathayibacter oskolensis]
MSDETPEQARARRRRALLWVVPLLALLIGGLLAVTLAIGGFAARSMTGAQPVTPVQTIRTV